MCFIGRLLCAAPLCAFRNFRARSSKIIAAASSATNVEIRIRNMLQALLVACFNVELTIHGNYFAAPLVSRDFTQRAACDLHQTHTNCTNIVILLLLWMIITMNNMMILMTMIMIMTMTIRIMIATEVDSGSWPLWPPLRRRTHLGCAARLRFTGAVWLLHDFNVGRETRELTTRPSSASSSATQLPTGTSPWAPCPSSPPLASPRLPRGAAASRYVHVI